MAHSSMCGASRGSFRRYTGSNRRQAKELDKCRHVARYFCSHSAGLLRIWMIVLNASQQADSLNTISRFDHALVPVLSLGYQEFTCSIASSLSHLCLLPMRCCWTLYFRENVFLHLRHVNGVGFSLLYGQVDASRWCRSSVC